MEENYHTLSPRELMKRYEQWKQGAETPVER